MESGPDVQACGVRPGANVGPQPIDSVKTITEEGSKHQIKASGESEESRAVRTVYEQFQQEDIKVQACQ